MGCVLVTGSTGFVGRHLVDALREQGHCVVQAVRGRSSGPDQQPSICFDLNAPDSLSPSQLNGIDCIYHLAARVHVMHAGPGDEDLFRRLNVHATQVLARRAAAAGVKRFVYLSSIKVNGERTHGRPFTAHDQPSPEDAYGKSKLEAEQALLKIAADTGLEVVIVRPPLIYGPGVGANFRRLLALVERGWPLPFGSVRNKRSLVSIWNLISLLLVVRDSPDAPGKVWLVSDNDDLSTSDLVRYIGKALGRREARLMPAPVGLLRLLGAAAGRQAEVGRLLDSLQVDITETCAGLDWKPPMSAQEGIERTVQWFKESRRGVG